MAQLKLTHTPKGTPKQRSLDSERDPFKLRIAQMANYILAAHQKEGAIDAKKYELVYNYLRLINPTWLRRLLADQEIDPDKINTMLHPKVVQRDSGIICIPQIQITTVVDYQKPAVNDSCMYREISKTQILKDLEKLLTHHCGSEICSFIRQWIPSEDFVRRVQVKAMKMDYERVIAEYYADKTLFDHDITPELPEEAVA